MSMPPTHRVVTQGGFRVVLDLRPQVLAIEAPEERELMRGSLHEWLKQQQGKPPSLRVDTEVKATLAEAAPKDFLSASVLGQKAKIFDDGLYAAMEVAAQEGAGRLAGKAALLRSLARTLARLLALTRETHIKQLEFPASGAALGDRVFRIFIGPELAAEPLPTFYLRRALAYHFIRRVLTDSFGEESLATLRRLTASGAAAMPLGEELAEIEGLFVGAHVQVSRQLGLAPAASVPSKPGADVAAEHFLRWMDRLDAEPDLGQDLRCMVPVFHDLGRGKTKVWAFLGWSRRPIKISFDRRPEAKILDGKGCPAGNRARIVWTSLDREVVYPVTAEVYVDRILDRDEFRALCDGCRTRNEILARVAG
jgi:hypothetical protein